MFAYTVYPLDVTNLFSNIPFFTSQITIFGTSCERPIIGDLDDFGSSIVLNHLRFIRPHYK